MIDQVAKYTFTPINTDVSPYKKDTSQSVTDLKNFRFNTNLEEHSISLVNEKGLAHKTTLPSININLEEKEITYSVEGVLKVLPFTTEEISSQIGTSKVVTDHIILGHSTTRDGFAIVTTDNNGVDCIWTLSDTFELTLLYLRNLNLSSNNPVQIISNFENEKIEKLYMVDGRNQLKFVNIKQSIENGDDQELIDLDSTLLNMSGDFVFSQPRLLQKSQGGSHTAGVIQYGYVQYRANGSSTKLSPLSELITLDNGLDGGGKVNETVSTYPIIKIDTLDPRYSNIRLYALKYTSYNELPEARLLVDQRVTGTSFTYYDTGTYISTLGLAEFMNLSTSTIYTPKHIQSKDNRLFISNFREKEYSVKNLDTRAYSYRQGANTTTVYQRLAVLFGGIVGADEGKIIVEEYDDVPEKHNCLNEDFTIFAYQKGSNVLGGSGKNLNWRIKRIPVLVNGPDVRNFEDLKGRFLKDREYYRLGIQFYNNKAQVTEANWITDFIVNVKNNKSNISSSYASIEIEFTNDFYVWLNTSSNFLDDNGVYDPSLKPVGFKLLRAERTNNDKSIITQGFTNGTVVLKNTSIQVNGESHLDLNLSGKLELNSDHKMPSLMRAYDQSVPPLKGMWGYSRLDDTSEYHPPLIKDIGPDGNTGRGNYKKEMFNSVASGGRRSRAYQFNQLMTYYSPEITFSNSVRLDNTRFHPIHTIESTAIKMWGSLVAEDPTRQSIEAKLDGAITYWHNNIPMPEEIEGNAQNNSYAFGIWGTIGPQGVASEFYHGAYQKYQHYREYTGNVRPFTTFLSYEVYGTPQIIETGAGRTLYNNDNDLAFYNSLEGLNTDTGEGSDYSPSWRVTRVNSFGAKCAIFALGKDSVETVDRKKLETIFSDGDPLNIVYYAWSLRKDLILPFNRGNVTLVGEFVLDRNLTYLGSFYGGNTYEAKRRTRYVEIGEFKNFSDLENNKYTCLHAGDTYIGSFKVAKLVKTDTEVLDIKVPQFTEIVNVNVESSINLHCRSDFSNDVWDKKFQPSYDEYHNYNEVYSQENNFFIRTSTEYTFKEVSTFETGVMASKLKTPGELMDSWTSLLPNEVMYLDGAYGPINGLVKVNDNVFTVQDRGVALININPRVQVQAEDGMGIELGTGGILHEFKYLTTSSGSKHKWSIVVSPSTFYYYDAVNNGIYRLSESMEELNKTKGLNSFFKQKINPLLYQDNPILTNGVLSGYDHIYNDVHMIFLNEDPEKCYSLAFNEMIQGFLRYDYHTSMFMSKGGVTLNVKDDNKIYQMFEGEYNNFYGEIKPSNVKLLMNPSPDIDTVFNTLQYTSDVFDEDNKELASESLTKLRTYNEYLDSGDVILVNSRNGNMKRFFREWKITIPRNSNSRERMRGTWMYADLVFENSENKRIRLNDIILHYSN